MDKCPSKLLITIHSQKEGVAQGLRQEIFEFQASLICIESSRPDRDIQGDPVSLSGLQEVRHKRHVLVYQWFCFSEIPEIDYYRDSEEMKCFQEWKRKLWNVTSQARGYSFRKMNIFFFFKIVIVQSLKVPCIYTLYTDQIQEGGQYSGSRYWQKVEIQ